MILAPTVLTTASGINVDLLNPRAEDIDFDDIAEHLAKENRYNGATPGQAYSVAEHLVRGCNAILEDCGDESAAAYFLLHDCPEAYLKDDPTPKKVAVATLAQEKFGILAGEIMAAFDGLTTRFDKAIAEAAGLGYPWPPRAVELVQRYDRIMLVTEWRDLKQCPMPFTMPPGIAALPDTIFPWDWSDARLQLELAFNRLLPACAKRLRAEKIIDEADYAHPDGTPVRDGARD